jgi:hypothetical protein
MNPSASDWQNRRKDEMLLSASDGSRLSDQTEHNNPFPPPRASRRTSARHSMPSFLP